MLGGNFNEMVGNLEEAYWRQQRFVADASHELRAPITSIRCNLDLLATAPDLPAEEARSALADAQAEAARMGRLVNDLLTLARSDDAAEEARANGYKQDTGQGQKSELNSQRLEGIRKSKPAGENAHSDNKLQGPRRLQKEIRPVTGYPHAD